MATVTEPSTSDLSDEELANIACEIEESPRKTAEEESPSKSLSADQRARVERSRQKALLLRKSRLAAQPYPKGNPNKDKVGTKSPQKVTRLIDSGAGFLIEEDNQEAATTKVNIIHPEGPVIDGDALFCDGCGKEFLDSYFYKQFNAEVCDVCKEGDDEQKYKLITKTDARNTYLLKDADFDKREPELRFILRKNPRDPRWGDMKLYFEPQVAERALEVWGSEDALEEERQRKDENREKLKQRKYEKKIKDLRKAVRSSLWRKETEIHEHTYGEETCVDEDEDMYSKTCTECGHILTYEKM